MTILAGAKVDATDFDLPDPVLAYGNGTNSLTSSAGVFAVLPTTTCTASITNPHPTAPMLTLVSFGAWCSMATSGDVRLGLDVSGALTVAAGLNSLTTQGWGEVPFANVSQYSQLHSTITVSLPAGSTTFKVYGYRSAANTATVNYPTLRLVPIRYVL